MDTCSLRERYGFMGSIQPTGYHSWLEVELQINEALAQVLIAAAMGWVLYSIQWAPDAKDLKLQRGALTFGTTYDIQSLHMPTSQLFNQRSGR